MNVPWKSTPENDEENTNSNEKRRKIDKSTPENDEESSSSNEKRRKIDKSTPENDEESSSSNEERRKIDRSTPENDEESSSSDEKRRKSDFSSFHIVESIELRSFYKETEKVTKVNVLDRIYVPCVTSELSCNFRNDVKCTFGVTDGKMNAKHAEKCIASWIPDIHGNLPEYLLAASDNLYLYEDVSSDLILKGFFANIEQNNPIISCGWCTHNPQYVGSMQLNGDCSIWSLNRKDKVIIFDHQHVYKPNWNNVDTNIGMCFYHGSSKHCFMTYNGKTVNFVNDIRCPANSYVHDFENPIFSVKNSLRRPWLVSCAERKNVSIIDVRFPNQACSSMTSFDPSDNATCFSWSMNGDIAIGTEEGKFILWSPENNEIQKDYDINFGYIYSLEYHRTARDILFVCH
ncbi:uncharacterized protein LOC111635330 isoform X2 [Centruroides sculpturatus]|uniref:uncharacterized protein LOC111635327 isoform X2 n=1 Tax=Centruroides sculpturatus TaxID=218467 RepID=UPI000C6D7093|nr:uncharacterized protein LOC111635327 isoform X2 [Centruroides sculpturatus]XP_023236037.1 uncharacterized protein LOC111635330 isoform X2 [Centruroides sculpturatus]